MSVKRTGALGRGLDALFEQTAEQAKVSVIPDESGEIKTIDSEDAVYYIDITDIIPNSSQPRKSFDESKIDELAESIKTYGLIQPIILRKNETQAPEKYEIVAGERRWRAATKAGLKKIPALVRKFTEKENMIAAVIENMQREDLNPIEEAMAFEQIMTKYEMTQFEVSSIVGKSRPYITNSIRLLKLPDAIKNFVSEKKISGAHARTLLAIEDENVQVSLAEKVSREGISVRELEKIVNDYTDKSKSEKKKKIRSQDSIRCEKELSRILGYKIKVSDSNKKGKIEIKYKSTEEFNKIVEMLKSLGD